MRKRGAEAAPSSRREARRRRRRRGPRRGLDDDDLTDEELEELEDELVDQASAPRDDRRARGRDRDAHASSSALAKQVRDSGTDSKWEELSSSCRTRPRCSTPSGARRKLIVFTEHRDTLNYLVERLRHAARAPGGGRRDPRRRRGARSAARSRRRSRRTRTSSILVATDAAGEGINLQRAHLVVNYDLPWNPNRIEQRFGRVHRIGQTEVCHLWNLVAEDTREGEVFTRLFEKLEEQRKALGDQVFDVLGEAFRDALAARPAARGDPLRRARPRSRPSSTRSSTRPSAIASRDVVHERALASEVMTQRRRRAHQRGDGAGRGAQAPAAVHPRLLPRGVRLLGGRAVEREPGRFEITHVPADLRRRDRQIGDGRAGPHQVRAHHLRARSSCASRASRWPSSSAPGHPLLDACSTSSASATARSSSRARSSSTSPMTARTPRLLVYLEHAVQDGAHVDVRRPPRRLAALRVRRADADGRRPARRAGRRTSTVGRSTAEERALVERPAGRAVAEPRIPSARRSSTRSGRATRGHLDEVQAAHESIASSARPRQSRSASRPRSATGTTAPTSSRSRSSPARSRG